PPENGDSQSPVSHDQALFKMFRRTLVPEPPRGVIRFLCPGRGHKGQQSSQGQKMDHKGHANGPREVFHFELGLIGIWLSRHLLGGLRLLDGLPYPILVQITDFFHSYDKVPMPGDGKAQKMSLDPSPRTEGDKACAPMARAKDLQCSGYQSGEWSFDIPIRGF